MDQNIKAQWVSALRSGQYQQGTDYLHRKNDEGVDTFCCLGVLSDLATKAGAARINKLEKAKRFDVDTREWIDSDETLISYGPTTGNMVEAYQLPPGNVCDWAGLPDEDPAIYIDDDSSTTLSELNDGGRTFSEIADLIEEQL